MKGNDHKKNDKKQKGNSNVPLSIMKGSDKKQHKNKHKTTHKKTHKETHKNKHKQTHTKHTQEQTYIRTTSWANA